MVRDVVIVAMVCYFGLASAQYRYAPYVYPVHRAELRALQDESPISEPEYQVVSTDQDAQEVVEYDPFNVSLLGLVWNYLPSPITAIKLIFKTIFSNIWKIAKLLIPADLVLLGMGLVVGFCAFTPYCTLIIEEPIASKIRAFKNNIPYIDDLHHFVSDAINKVHELQG